METTYRNLLPEYRRAMEDKVIETMDDIEKFGKYWERQKEMNSRCSPSYGRQNESDRCGTVYRYGRQDESGGRVTREEAEAVTTNPETTENKPSEKELKRGANNPPRGPAKTADEGENTLTAKLCAMELCPPEEELAASATAQQPAFPNGRPKNGFPPNATYRENRANNWRNPNAGQGQGPGQVGGPPPTTPNRSNAYASPATYPLRGFLGT